MVHLSTPYQRSQLEDINGFSGRSWCERGASSVHGHTRLDRLLYRASFWWRWRSSLTRSAPPHPPNRRVDDAIPVHARRSVLFCRSRELAAGAAGDEQRFALRGVRADRHPKGQDLKGHGELPASRADDAPTLLCLGCISVWMTGVRHAGAERWSELGGIWSQGARAPSMGRARCPPRRSLPCEQRKTPGRSRGFVAISPPFRT